MSLSNLGKFPRVDIRALTRDVGVDFEQLCDVLLRYYADIDEHNARNSEALDLPCGRGCSACCHEAVFLTPLEFLAAWDWAQQHLSGAQREAAIVAGLALYDKHREAILAFDEPPPDGQADHFLIAQELHYTCPLLAEDGSCLVYPVRELAARLFGVSFNDAGGVYGCLEVGSRLGGQTVTLVSAERACERLLELPFGNKRQVYPYFLHMLYADPSVPVLGEETARA
jgi:hypothetical protein